MNVTERNFVPALKPVIGDIIHHFYSGPSNLIVVVPQNPKARGAHFTESD